MEDITAVIIQKLDDIEEQEHVTILHAVESGSRAWGFASPDSDYDVRFIYVRSGADYLALNEPRDVIEWQLDEVLDINGWDIKKVLKQFYRSNAGLFEWSNSPIVYKTTEAWGMIYDAARDYFSVKAAAYHYYGTAKSTEQQYLQDDTVRYKKYLYALRPLLASRYILANHCPPPVLFEELLEAEIPDDLRNGIARLLEIKKYSGESEYNTQIPVIRDFIREEINRQKVIIDSLEDDRSYDWQQLNDAFRFLFWQENRL